MAINKVGSKGIVDCSVAAADFAPGTITSAKIADDAVTNAKLSNSSLTASGTSIALGASGTLNNAFIDWQTKVTSDGSTVTTMVAGRGYFVDNSSAAGIVKLPISASIGDIVAIKDYAGNFATNKLTIQRNGHNIQGVANNSEISTNRASLVLVYVDATKGWLYTDEHNVGDLQNNLFISATGGTVTTSGDFKIHTFTGDGNFVVSQVGAGTGPSVVDYVVVAGGGAGGNNPNTGGGGGGAGGFRESHSTPVSGSYTASPLATPTGITVTTATFPITVGAGGGGDSNHGCSGSNSVFSTITSAGGGGGGGSGSSAGKNGGSGGGGGGSPEPGSSYSGGSGNTPPVSPPQGRNGGSTSGNQKPGSGGGGAGGVGGNSPSTTAGSGVASEITASSVTYSTGGAGSPNSNNTGSSGTANEGDGGNGGRGNNGGSGGKGVVIIRYKFQ